MDLFLGHYNQPLSYQVKQKTAMFMSRSRSNPPLLRRLSDHHGPGGGLHRPEDAAGLQAAADRRRCRKQGHRPMTPRTRQVNDFHPFCGEEEANVFHSKPDEDSQTLWHQVWM